MSAADAAGRPRPFVPIVTCEHAGNRVPAPYRERFAASRELLATHRGYDVGALAAARELGRILGVEPIVHLWSRLLVDTNRSPGHPRLFSERTAGLSRAERERIVAEYHRPHRARVEAAVARAVATGAIAVQIGVHSFAPVLEGEARNADVGLLYDPARAEERRLALAWRSELREAEPTLRVRRNYPYRGTADGLVTSLRSAWSAERYLGLELELSQGLLEGEGAAPATRVVGEALRRALRALTASADDPGRGPRRPSPRP